MWLYFGIAVYTDTCYVHRCVCVCVCVCVLYCGMLDTQTHRVHQCSYFMIHTTSSYRYGLICVVVWEAYFTYVSLLLKIRPACDWYNIVNMGHIRNNITISLFCIL